MSPVRIALAAMSVATALDAGAVRLDPEAGGQALIYPYYTVRSYGSDPFNTYISLVNTSADGKALRVRFREAREGLETLGLNVFLAPNDTWTAALVPSIDGGTQLISADRSCATYAGPADSTGLYRQPMSALFFAADGLDRTREGYVEVFEMGTVKGATLAAITQDASGVPHDCGAVQLRPVDGADIAAPSGGLEGTLTLINVASGMDATVNAEALADLASKPYYRPVLDSYPDWNIAEVDPVSIIRNATHAYRLAWANGVQAVDSVLMRTQVSNEFILDPATASSTDWVVTLPTRRLHVSSSTVTAPFTVGATRPGCEVILAPVFNREAQGYSNAPCSYNFDDCPQPPPQAAMCTAATVLPWTVTGFERIPVFGSRALLQPSVIIPVAPSSFMRPTTTLPPFTYNGAIRMTFDSNGARSGLVSLASSSRVDLRTGVVETGAFGVKGLPIVGFMARAFLNGTLSCTGASCQGNYASAFPHHGTIAIDVAP